jgi:arylsulfatase A-like enzyme
MRATTLLIMVMGVLLAAPAGRAASASAARERPNVLIILTDDQGYGDLGCHGNDKIDTPTMDRLASQGLRMTQFYAMPVCTPTRACLMTGRYNFRTRAIDTMGGRAMMDPEEVTIAETFRAAGYRTAMFGKWHLGDNYPLRPMDQGFEFCLRHRGGGIADTSDFPGNKYTNPLLLRNGVAEQFEGYCTDIFTNEALAYLDAHHEEPFFIYFASNIPHDPLQGPGERYVKPFEGKGLTPETPTVYGMIKNLDDNIARLLKKLDELHLADNTIVIFMSDNGPAMQRSEHDLRYNANLRGEKKDVYEGGIRVPCFVRWPGKIAPGRTNDRLAHAIDVYPTLCDACGITPPPSVKLDGVSLIPLWLDQARDWPDRTIHFQWHRGDKPELYRNCASRNQRYKLVNGRELYDLSSDPAEAHDVAAQHPDLVARFRAEYEQWFKDVCATRGFDPPPIVIGSEHENPSELSPQDLRSDQGDASGAPGHWTVMVSQPGSYRFRLRCYPGHHEPSPVHLKVATTQSSAPFIDGQLEYTFDAVRLDPGPAQIRAWIDGAAPPKVMRVVTVERVGQE